MLPQSLAPFHAAVDGELRSSLSVHGIYRLAPESDHEVQELVSRDLARS